MVEDWAATEGAQALVGGPLKALRTAFAAACPAGKLEVDTPDGPRRKRGPAAGRLIVAAGGTQDDSVVTRVWGYFR